ncbi:MAG: RNA polymerase sigma factor [Phycisphaerales bacterium]|nr:RNA polymerase sigma factor [Phycisphaerales bacterium]
MELRPPTTGPADADLVQQTLAGDRDAFDLLIERYQRRATAVSYRLLGNLHDALEVCQESFVRAFSKLATLSDRERFGPWLLRIVSNLSLNYRRSRGPRISFEDCILGDDASRAPGLADAEHHDTRPGARLSAFELEERIQAALGELTEQQRTALVLFSMEQMPQKEVAEIMACSVEAVKWHVFQARKRMRVFLADYL